MQCFYYEYVIGVFLFCRKWYVESKGLPPYTPTPGLLVVHQWKTVLSRLAWALVNQNGGFHGGCRSGSLSILRSAEKLRS